jgi:hypothetical protein
VGQLYKAKAIQEFLSTAICPVAKMYTKEMEVQVNVAKGTGVAISGKFKGKRWRAWRDTSTGEQWKAFRIPWNADTFPTYRDSKMMFSLEKHVEGIGMTGWNWSKRQSLWVGYDFDSLVNHVGGISENELNDLVTKTREIPWVNLMRSTSGTGYHLYIFFEEPVETKTHTEHSALARSLVSVLTAETGYNFLTNVDCVGSILWVYHRKQEGTDGLTWKKEGTEKFPNSKIPLNWREHILVTSKKAKKIRSPRGLDVSIAGSTGQNPFLQEDHHRVLKWFNNKSTDFIWWWDTDYSMLVCHTVDLKNCHKELKLKGYFDTNSRGKDYTQNAFCFPADSGSFVVRRFGKSVKEHHSWSVDDSGWTHCSFNAHHNYKEAVMITKGLENSKGDIVYGGTKKAAEALKILGAPVPNFTEDMLFRPVFLKKKSNKILVKVSKGGRDISVPSTFVEEKDFWVTVVTIEKKPDSRISYDHLVRATVSEGVESGWYCKVGGEWILQPKTNVASILTSQTTEDKKIAVDKIMGSALLTPFILVNRPFEEEYLGDRVWNKDSAQLAMTPEEGETENWWNLFDHIGSGLDSVVQDDVWCQEHGIITGGEYIFAWCASIFQYPERPLPYLFLFGGQNTGKSTLHEALSLLFTKKRGYSRVDHALKDKSGFNYELAHSVLAVVEEIDLSNDKVAANRVKDWVTGDTISIRQMYRNTVDIKNTLHFIHCSNDLSACPVYSGDTRITVVQVGHLDKEIPKSILLKQLALEAPAILYEFLSYTLPDPKGRLNIPVLETEEKDYLMEDNTDVLNEFINERGIFKAGHYVSVKEFGMEFFAWISGKYPFEERNWNIRKIRMEFPLKKGIVKGIYKGEETFGNFTLDTMPEDLDFKFIKKKNNLVKEVEDELQ